MLPFKRTERLAKVIYETVAVAMVQEVSDPRLQGVTVTHAKLTNDLSIAKIYFYKEGDQKARDNCLKGFKSAKGFLKQKIKGELSLRIMPELEFYFDEGVEKEQRIEEAFEKIKHGL